MSWLTAITTAEEANVARVLFNNMMNFGIVRLEDETRY
jgi:hypothetical protein